MQRILFIVKYREAYDGSGRCGYDGTPASFGGLFHSALFVVQMLRASGVEAKLVQVCDDNDIDREVYSYKPDICIIEALWVVPEKFAVLQRLHPQVKWIVRCHSEIPFLAYEGVAIEWICRYVQLPNVYVAANSSYAVQDFRSIAWIYNRKILYLPNYYPVIAKAPVKKPNSYLDIGCFGAIRPLKNQLIQALAAIEFTRSKKMPLRFHINTRVEQGGQSVLKNIRALFHYAKETLIEHTWETREAFLHSLAQTDLGMQVSFSETFDITAADTVSLGIPLVTSNEVVWAESESQAFTTNTASILAKLNLALSHQRNRIVNDNIHRLRAYCNESKKVWLNFA